MTLPRQVKNWMTKTPVNINPQSQIADVHAAMRDQHIRHLPVIDQDKLVGLVSYGDVREAMAQARLDAPSARVDAIMHRDIRTTTPDQLILEAAFTMLNCKIGCLPVLDHDGVVGIITESDLLRALIADEATRWDEGVASEICPD
jgi:predicted transcriptional regulator